MTTPPPPSSPPADWYPDPHYPEALRYWNGSAWTDHVAPGGPGPVGAGPAVAPATSSGMASAGPSEAIHWIVPVGRSWESIVAGYLGLACLLFSWTGPFVWVLSGATVWVAVLALRKASDGGHGRGRAIAGIVMAGLGAIVGAYVLVNLAALS